MTQKRTLIPTLLTIGLSGAFACSGAESFDSESDGELQPEVNVATPSDVTIIAELAPGEDTHIKFMLREASSTDPDSAVLIVATSGGPTGIPDPLAALVTEHGELTTLEMYLALAPQEQVPPVELVQAHPLEALAINRRDVDEVRQVSLTSDWPGSERQLKISTQGCKDLILSNASSSFTWTNTSAQIHTGVNNGPFYFCVGGQSNFWFGSDINSCTTAFTGTVVTGICNDSAEAGTMQNLYKSSGGSTVFSFPALAVGSNRWQLAYVNTTESLNFAVLSRLGAVSPSSGTHHVVRGFGSPP